jgi:hypothetical protein
LTCRLLILVIPEAAYRRHVIVVVRLGSGFIGRILAGVFGDIFCFYSAKYFIPSSSFTHP